MLWNIYLTIITRRPDCYIFQTIYNIMLQLYVNFMPIHYNIISNLMLFDCSYIAKTTRWPDGYIFQTINNIILQLYDNFIHLYYNIIANVMLFYWSFIANLLQIWRQKLQFISFGRYIAIRRVFLLYTYFMRSYKESKNYYSRI